MPDSARFRTLQNGYNRSSREAVLKRTARSGEESRDIRQTGKQGGNRIIRDEDSRLPKVVIRSNAVDQIEPAFSHGPEDRQEIAVFDPPLSAFIRRLRMHGLSCQIEVHRPDYVQPGAVHKKSECGSDPRIDIDDLVTPVSRVIAEIDIDDTAISTSTHKPARALEHGWVRPALSETGHSSIRGILSDLVGHLFLDPRERSGIRTTDADAPVFYGRDLVEKIRLCATPQEIGSHSFTHRIFDDPLCTPAIAEQEIADSVKAARDMGLELKSFAFPRNRIGHIDVLAAHGFTSFRGQDARWYSRTTRRRWFHRAGHLLDMFCATTPATVIPERHESGIWEIPGSMLYTPSHGLRRIVPAWTRVHRARKGLRAAAEQKKIFHLWFHPTDVVVRNEAMLDGLRQILETACAMREAGRLTILPMAGIVDLLERPKQPAGAVLALEDVTSR